MPVRILIVDDHEVVRQGVRSILLARPQWEICGEASDGHEAVRLAANLQPDAIIMDVTMPVMGGLAAASRILQSKSNTKVLIFTMHESPTLAKLVHKLGAQGFVVKSQATRYLVKALETVLAGDTFFPSDEKPAAEDHGRFEAAL
jgi:DNA-binding NarL/FixJ family response regulator